jgi:hemerythrin-like domain-containing protein
MKATDILKNEHRVIEQVLNCLEKIADRSLAEGELDCRSAMQAVEFLQHFADHCHHGKEEGHLFPLLEARGFSRQNGPTGVMLLEHQEGRHHIQTMKAAIAQAATGVPQALERFTSHAQAYIRLLRVHIFKEDRCLFPMANEVLSDQDQRSLEESFDDVETCEMGRGTHEKYLQLADELADRFDVLHAAAAATATTGCLHHLVSSLRERQLPC